MYPSSKKQPDQDVRMNLATDTKPLLPVSTVLIQDLVTFYIWENFSVCYLSSHFTAGSSWRDLIHEDNIPVAYRK